MLLYWLSIVFESSRWVCLETALFKVAPFSDAAHQDTTMDLVHVDLVPCGPNGGMGVLLIVGLVIIVLAIVLVGLVFACSCYYKSKVKPRKFHLTPDLRGFWESAHIDQPGPVHAS